ncbi:MAG: hypothetical protein ACRENE_24925 [Polyangiaceae bacterium]
MMVAWATLAGCSTTSQSAENPGDTDSGGASDAGHVPIKELNGDANSGAPVPIVCGDATCTASNNGLVTLSPCCLPDETCGATFGLAMFTDAAGAASNCVDTAAGTPDDTCPSQMVMGRMLAGCCSAKGSCGLDLSIAGLGCNPLSALTSLPAGMDSGPPQSCSAVGDAAADRTDAGVIDAGTD